jgi:hypothetical protein
LYGHVRIFHDAAGELKLVHFRCGRKRHFANFLVKEMTDVPLKVEKCVEEKGGGSKNESFGMKDEATNASMPGREVVISNSRAT